MATESVSNLLNLYKEVWTDDRLNKQFYSEARFLDRIQKTNKYTIGRQAEVPVELSLPAGTSTFLAAGGTLNPADTLHVNRADYTLSYLYQQVSLQVAALNQGDSVGNRSTVDTLDQTVVSNINGLRKEANRQVVGNQDALIAKTTGTATSATIALDPTGYGYDAIVRGWLRPGHTVDIGTTAAQTSVVAGAVIQSVSESSVSPSITINSSVTLAGTTYVSIANARAGATSNETNGLRNIIGSTSTVVGGINPSTVPAWQPAYVDTTTTLVSLDLLTTLQQKQYQKVGAVKNNYVTTSPYQMGQLYQLFQNQVRFTRDDVSAGNVDGFTWNGMNVAVDPDIPNRELYMLNLDDFLVVTGGKFSSPTWFSDIEGSGGRTRWVQGTTTLGDAIVYPLQLGVKRRNSHAAAINLTA